MAGEKFDVYIHPSNLLVTALNMDDKRRSKRIKGAIEHTSPAKSDDGTDAKDTQPTKQADDGNGGGP